MFNARRIYHITVGHGRFSQTSTDFGVFRVIMRNFLRSHGMLYEHKAARGRRGRGGGWGVGNGGEEVCAEKKLKSLFTIN